MHYYEHDIIYTYGFGYRLDAQPKCKPGNKPCGKTCIPMKEKCKSKSNLGTQVKNNLNTLTGIVGVSGLTGIGLLTARNLSKKKNNKQKQAESVDTGERSIAPTLPKQENKEQSSSDKSWVEESKEEFEKWKRGEDVHFKF